MKSPAVNKKPVFPPAEVEIDGKKFPGALFSNKTKAIIWGLQTRAVQVRKRQISIVSKIENKSFFFLGHDGL